MSTFTYDIFGVRLNDAAYDDIYDDGFSTFYSQTMEIQSKDGGGFSYSIDSVAADGTPLVSLEFQDTYWIEFGGFLPYAVIYLEQAYVYDLTWSDGGTTRTTTILMTDFDFGPDGMGQPLYHRYYVELGGDALPGFGDLAGFESFLSQTTEISPASGALAEGVVIPWETTAADQSKENDFITVGTASVFYAIMGYGDPIVDAGTGFDQLHLESSSDAPEGVTVDVAAGEITGFYDYNTGTYDLSYHFTNFELYWGTAQADTFIGDDAPNQFRGLDGADIFTGNGGSDTVRYDKDYQNGGMSAVLVNLKQGFAIDGFGAQDTVDGIERAVGTQFNDVLIGDANANVLKGLDGNDRLSGIKGDDQLFGELGNDILKGGDGDDLLSGGRGFDVLLGGGGDDVIYGGAGNDSAEGGDGNDVIRAGGGDDFLKGGAGDDVLNGGDGFDDLGYSGGQDRIVDFEDDIDTLIFAPTVWGGHALTAADILGFAETVGNDTVFDFGSGNTLTIQDHTDLDALENDISTGLDSVDAIL